MIGRLLCALGLHRERPEEIHFHSMLAEIGRSEANPLGLHDRAYRLPGDWYKGKDGRWLQVREAAR